MSEKKIYQNLWGRAKALLRKKLTAINNLNQQREESHQKSNLPP